MYLDTFAENRSEISSRNCLIGQIATVKYFFTGQHFRTVQEKSNLFGLD